MKKAIFFLTIIFFSNLVGIYFRMYFTWWFDMLHHFLGGFFVAMLMFYYLSDILELRIAPNHPAKAGATGQANFELKPLKKILIIVGAVTFIGVVWEFTEYLASQILIEPIYRNFGVKTFFIGDLDDTINDLLMDIVGALAYATPALLKVPFVRKKSVV